MLIQDNGEAVATLSFQWISAFKGRGTYNGKRYEVFSRHNPFYEAFLKREDDLDYWGKFEKAHEGNDMMFILRDLRKYNIINSGHRTFDLFNSRGEKLATMVLCLTALRKTSFTLLQLDHDDPEPSLLAIVRLLVA